MRGFILSVVFSAVFLSGSGDTDPFPKDYFRSPLDIPLFLSGGFAEMRSNHFHAGLDIKTQGQEGAPVHAAADGWVSRINVSASGYGNALYISHPNGYQTVYAHLSRYAPVIREAIESEQYSSESFEVQLFPEKGRFPVSKGDIVAWTGNTGGSAGPHLHFEIRDEATSEPLNPMLFGFPVTDTLPPRIFRIKVFAVDSTSVVRIEDRVTGGWRRLEAGESAFVEVVRTPSGLAFERVGRIEASGAVAFGIQTHDYHNGSNNRLGVFRIALQANGEPLYASEMQRFSFNETRYINAHVDFPEYRTTRRWVQRSFVLPGNRLPMYTTRSRGIFRPEPGSSHAMEYIVEDAMGNVASLPFSVTGADLKPEASAAKDPERIIHWDQPWTFTRPDISVRIPEGALYDDEVFGFSQMPGLDGITYSDRFRLHDAKTPLQESILVRIQADEVPAELRDKVLVGLVDERGSVSSAGGSWSNGNVSTRVRSFGTFAIVADTTAPSIRVLGLVPDGRVQSRIQLRIRDNLSGLNSVEARIDGEWRLFEHDAKNSLFTHSLDGRTAAGRHELTVRATDNKGNTATYTTTFRR